MPNRTYLWSEGRGNRFLDVTQEHGTKQQHKLLASVKTAFLHVPNTNPLPPTPTPPERNSNRVGQTQYQPRGTPTPSWNAIFNVFLFTMA